METKGHSSQRGQDGVDGQETGLIPAVRDSEWFRTLPDRMLEHLGALANSYAEGRGFDTVTRLVHSLQSATLASEAGKDDEYVVCCLLHDVGDLLAPYNHGEFVATLLQPFIGERNHWMLAHHHPFQGYYYFEYLGLDKHMRDRYRDHPYFGYTLEFCEKYDMPAFDPEMKHLSLEAFEPALRRVLSQPIHSIYVASGTD